MGLQTKDSPKSESCPSCPNCGHATTKSLQDYTFHVGGGEEFNTKPLVRAVVTVNLPVYRCLNPGCNTCLYGQEAEDIIQPIKTMLESNAIPDRR